MPAKFERLKTALSDGYAVQEELGRTRLRKPAGLLPRVNPRLAQLTVAKATVVPNVGLPTDRRAAALAVVKNTNSDHSSVSCR